MDGWFTWLFNYVWKNPHRTTDMKVNARDYEEKEKQKKKESQLKWSSNT